MTARLRILLVGKGAPDRGGIAAFIGMMRQSLSATHDVSLLNLTRPDASPSARWSLVNARRTVADAWSVWRSAPGHDVVHLQTALVPHTTLLRAGLLSAAARLRGVPTIVHVHNGQVGDWFSTAPRRALGRLALSPATRVVTVDRRSVEPLRRLSSAATVELIDNGIPVERFGPPGPGNDPPRIVYVGVLTPRKGVVDLLSASEILHAQGTAHEVVLVGGTPDEGSHAEEAVRAAAVAGHARCLGPQPHEAMPGILRDADIFCLPSWWEATPLSVLEAMATGVAVVASAVGDIPRLVSDGVTGVLVPPRDPSALAGALGRLLADAGLRAKMGAAGRERARGEFDVAATSERVAAAYADVARRPAGVAAP